jgi:alpha-beta hydrolase superfamily lysophospholipase
LIVRLKIISEIKMQTTSGTFQGPDQNLLYYQLHLPEGTPGAVLVFVHGVGEHSGRYASLIEGLAPAGLAVFVYDQRGHGQSDGRRVHIDSWEDYRGDLQAALRQVAAMLPGLPVFLYGHSMGSLVVLDYLIADPTGVSGAILSGAAIDPVGVGTPAQIVMAKILSRLWPTFQIKLEEGFSSKLSHDPAVIQNYDADPLVLHAVSARWGAESLKTVERIKDNPQAIQLPVLFIHGDSDTVNSVGGAKTYYDQIASPDKRLLVYPDCLHEPHNELLLRDQVVTDVTRWVNEVLEKDSIDSV